MTIENVLRETLHSYADEAQRDAGLLDAAIARSNRRRRRRLAVGTGMAVAAVAATALAVPATTGGTERPIPPLSQGLALEPPAYELPQFPFTPGWAPAGADHWYVQLLTDGEAVPLTTDEGASEIERGIRVYTAGEPVVKLQQWGGPDGPRIQTSVSAEPISVRPENYPDDLEPEPATVQGRDATLYTAGPWMAVTWRHQPDLWVMVQGHDDITTDDLLRYAEELVETPAPVTPFFTFDLVPAGAELTWMNDGQAWFGLPRADADDPVGEVNVVLLGQLPANLDDLGEPLRVGERDGLLLDEGRLVVFLGDGLALAVGGLGDLQLSQEELITFAAGVHVSPDARPMRAPAVPLDTPPDQSPYN